MSPKKIYLASPLGFSPETGGYLEKLKGHLCGLGFEVFDPWAQQEHASAIREAFAVENYRNRVAAFASIAAAIGAVNEQGIREADILLGVLDGMEVDCGTAAEIGFAAALGKRCYGLRTDMRDCGDFVGIPVNLQLLHFITGSGGKLFRSIAEIDIEPDR